MHKKWLILIVFAVFVCMSQAATAQEDQATGQEDLAKKSQNPVGDMISLPFENNTYFGIGPNDTKANALLIKPVYPLNLGSVNLINRLILPLVWVEGQPLPNDQGIEIGDGGTIFPSDLTQNKFGLGDTTYQGWLSPAAPGNVIWGAGAAFVFPTATDDALGSKKWAAGPSAVVLAMPGKWVIGMLAQNVWSFAGDEDAADVNSLLFQYFANYNMDKGWYLNTSPVITANWEADSDSRWTVPFGAGVGKLTRFGKQPVDFRLGAYYNVEKPKQAPDWSAQFIVKFIFLK